MLSLLAGPQAGIVIFANENLQKDGVNAFRKMGYGFNAGMQVTLGYVSIYDSFNQGISDISNMESSYKWTSRHMQFGVAIKIR